MIKAKKKDIFIEYCLLITGVTILAFGINAFYSDVDLVTGGFSGVAIIFRDLSDGLFGYKLPLWLTNTVLNIPLFFIGLKMFGFKKISKTVFAAFFLSFALYFTEFAVVLMPIENDLTLSAIYGGFVTGAGLSLVFRCMATTGGTDMLGMIAHEMHKSVSIARFMMVFDVIIIVAGMFVFGYTKSLYAIISVFVSSKVCDSILEGLHFAKAVFIISDNAESVMKSLMEKMGRGISVIYAKGAYTEKQRNILFTVVSRRETPIVKDIVADIDKKAFVIVTDVYEVLGEGFKEIDANS